MYQSSLPEGHPDIANVHHNIADYFQTKKQYEEALEHYRFSFSNERKIFFIQSSINRSNSQQYIQPS